MATLDSKLSVSDIQLLVDAVGDWEMNNNHDYHIMQIVKNTIVPDEEENQEQYEFVMQVKNHFKQREKEINDKRSLRQEQAIILKAKLMLLKNELDVDQIFDDAQESIPKIKKLQVNAPTAVVVVDEPIKDSKLDKLDKAESFLNQSKYAKIWELYQSDLNGKPSTLEKIEGYIGELGMTKHYLKYLEENL